MRKELLIGIIIGAGVVALLSGAGASSLLYGLLILACPLMMVFMMRGHGERDSTPHESRDQDRSTAPRN